LTLTGGTDQKNSDLTQLANIWNRLVSPNEAELIGEF
jgi:hypothetical protein